MPSGVVGMRGSYRCLGFVGMMLRCFGAFSPVIAGKLLQGVVLVRRGAALVLAVLLVMRVHCSQRGSHLERCSGGALA